MSAKISLLHLENYYLKELSYSIKDNLEKIPESIDNFEFVGLEISDTTTVLDATERKWRCELTVKSADADSTDGNFYNFRIVIIGFFNVNTDLQEDTAKMIAESNCPAVLYSTAREIIATITRRSPYPAVLLPLVTFIKIDEYKEEPKPKRKRASSGKKTK